MAGVEMIGEEFHPEPDSRVHVLEQFQPPPAPPAPAPAPRERTLEQIQALQAAQLTVQALASVLTARLAMFTVVLGSLILAVVNVVYPSDRGLIALGLFAALMIPMAWLAQRRVT